MGTVFECVKIVAVCYGGGERISMPGYTQRVDMDGLSSKSEFYFKEMQINSENIK